MPLVVASSFNPFTYEEMVRPIAIMDTAHQQLDTSYQTLSTQAATLANVLDPEKDAELYKTYNTFTGDLDKAAGDLAARGVNASSMKNLAKLRAAYATQIQPIEASYKRKLDDIKTQREALAKDNTLKFSYDASTTPISAYYNNPGLSYKQISMDKLTKSVSEIAKNYAKRILHEPSEWGATAEGQFLQRVIRQGLDDSDIEAALTGQNPALAQILQSALASAGADQFSPEVQQAALNAAVNGLRAGFGQDKIDTRVNDPYRIPLSAQRLRNAQLDEQLKWQRLLNDKLGGSGKTTKDANGQEQFVPGNNLNIFQDLRYAIDDRADADAYKDRVKELDNDIKNLKTGQAVKAHIDRGDLGTFKTDYLTYLDRRSLDQIVEKYDLDVQKTKVDNTGKASYLSDDEYADAVVEALTNMQKSMGDTYRPKQGTRLKLRMDKDKRYLLSTIRDAITGGEIFSEAFHKGNDKALNTVIHAEGYNSLKQMRKKYNKTHENKEFDTDDQMLNAIFASDDTDMMIDTANGDITIRDNNNDLTIRLDGSLIGSLDLVSPVSPLFLGGTEVPNYGLNIAESLDILTKIQNSGDDNHIKLNIGDQEYILEGEALDQVKAQAYGHLSNAFLRFNNTYARKGSGTDSKMTWNGDDMSSELAQAWQNEEVENGNQ